MRRSWPSASEIGKEAFEGKVLDRPVALVDFRLPTPLVPTRPMKSLEKSVVFVAPANAAGAEVDVPIEIDLDAIAEGSFPGSHWLTPPPALSEEIALRMSHPDRTELGDEEPTLPVLTLASRARSPMDALLDAGEVVVGRSASGRVARVGVLVSVLFAALAVHALVEPSPSFASSSSIARTTPARTEKSPVTAKAARTGQEAHAPSAVVLPEAAPIWIVAAPVAKSAATTPANAASSAAVPAPEHPDLLGLPRPPPAPPRSEFARL